MSAGAEAQGVSTETCELCIVGAGIGGLNALAAASRHLRRSDRVVLVDRQPRAGGMWTSVYPYVRLHQPHPMFTAGNIPWRLDEPRAHLANREEVLAHLARCFEELSRRVDLHFASGYEYEGHSEDAARGVVEVRCAPRAPGEPPLRIVAKRFVDARGFGITPKQALPLSSRAVKSVSPDFLSEDASELSPRDAPIYVVGGGKTGMDTAHTLIQRFPGRPLHLLIGAGTIFTEREKAYPTGLSRYFGGTLGTDLFLELSKRFDGHNEDAVTDYFREHHGVALSQKCRHHMFGVLSRSENDTIARGAKEVLLDHLVDVVDRADGPAMLLRSGKEQAVQPGSIFINATGYFSESARAYQPFCSKSERVLAIHPRSNVTFLPAYTGFLLVDAAYRGSLSRLPLYELDVVDLLERAKDAVLPTVATHTVHNVIQLMAGMPAATRKEFGANYGLWYPLHRQLLTGMRLLRFAKAERKHCQDNLDRVRERFGVRLGPLQHDARTAAE